MQNGKPLAPIVSTERWRLVRLPATCFVLKDAQTMSRIAWKMCLAVTFILAGGWDCTPTAHRTLGEDLTPNEFSLVKKLERERVEAIRKVFGSVIAIYDEDRQGGGSGVIIDPSGIALTNHHVIIGAGVSGWGGLADGRLYHWKLIGTDPGGDVSIIQMEGRDDFPFTPLGDSDQVKVGDWALAMGNPFILTEDQAPTVTLGIVSGVKRYQPGAGANQLVYGNCIQVDSSINPGNSGGPLFNLRGEVIGINGRGSFQDRGRVNVGLGYAISSNQIKNFVPDLLATKLVEHATLDASFSDREGKVVCSTINRDAPVAAAGLELGDELIEFEDHPIRNANQFTNLICTLPEDWPAHLKVRKPDGEVRSIHIRMFGLPYARPPRPRKKPGERKPTPEEQRRIKRQQAMVDLLAAPPGKVRFVEVNKEYAAYLVQQWRLGNGEVDLKPSSVVHVRYDVHRNDDLIGQHEIWLSGEGKVRTSWQAGDEQETFVYDGQEFFRQHGDQGFEKMSLVEAKTTLPLLQAFALLSANRKNPFERFGETQIDGSDKALAQVACRFKVLDADSDPLFFWLGMYDESHLPGFQLNKIAPHKNCDGEGGVVFREWEKIEGTQLPRQIDFVTGISEEVSLRLSHQSSERTDPPATGWFEIVSSDLSRSAARSPEPRSGIPERAEK
jgi:serine protease Do